MSQPVAIIRSIGGLVFDAVFKEHHESPAECTEQPVETGVSVSDHMFLKPLRVTISAGVSDVTFLPEASDPWAGGTSRAQMALAMLKQLQASFEPFDVQTGLMLYQNMVCTNISFEQDKDTPGAFIFDAELREVIIVSTQMVTYPPRAAGSTARQAGATKSLGQKQAVQVIDPNKLAQVGKSLADAMGVGKLFGLPQ
jgi:hypothetical protein